MTGQKIVFEGGRPQLTQQPILLYIEGDGIGPDIWRATKKVVDQAVAQVYQGERAIAWQEILAGQKAFEQTGSWLPDETIAAIREYKIALKGPLTTPIGEGFRSLNVTLRQTFDLFTCLRPVRYFAGVPSPVKEPEKTDIVIFRENTEDIYAGIEFAAGTAEVQKLIRFLEEECGVQSIRFKETSALGIKPISEEGSKRLIRAAINYALAEGRPTVTLVHKGNIMKYTEGGFKKWGYQLARQEFKAQTFTLEEYHEIKQARGQAAADTAYQQAKEAGKLFIKDRIADIFLQEALIKPETFDVVATMNLNGDYLSDALAAQVGGIGIAPGANLNQETGAAIFEATHGTAPEFAGTDRLNPSSMILSAALMLRYIGWSEVADQIEAALEQTIANKTVTEDFADYLEGATKLTGTQFATALLENLVSLSKKER